MGTQCAHKYKISESTMSQAHIEQFYGKASQDPALVNKMLAGTSDPEDFIRNAVKEGNAQGYQFTFEEAAAWIKQQQEIKASGELTDSQLESVAGGKGSTVNITSLSGNKTVATVAWTTNDPFDKAVSNFFSSW
jgi:predicted ribosomally synthesized peptide with nif11-like leader